MKDKIEVPILLIGFNRPDCLRKVLQKLEEIKPSTMYFAIDAPREGYEYDKDAVSRVVSLVKDISWECNCHYRIAEKNLGAEVNISSAVSWVLKDNDYVIVNEDDIYADYSYYKFVQDMLYHYRDDTRISHVCGLNLSPSCPFKKDSYFFSRSGHIWGWGTWKRVWKDFCLYEPIDDYYISTGYLNLILANHEIAKRTHYEMKNQQAKGAGNVTWDYMFWYYRLKNQYFAIVPNKNLITNIGIDGLHYHKLTPFNFMNRKSNFHISTFREFKWDKEYDIYNGTSKPILYRMFNRIIWEYRKRFVLNEANILKFFNS